MSDPIQYNDFIIPDNDQSWAILPFPVLQDNSRVDMNFAMFSQTQGVNCNAHSMGIPQEFRHEQFYHDIDTHAISFDKNFNIIPSSPRDQPRFMSPNSNLLTVDNITANDVLCGRGAGANTHAGNIRFRSLVGDYQQAYLYAKPLDKANIAKGIVSTITEKGGRFLKRSEEKDLDGKARFWYDIGFKAAREKTCQALRERAPSTFDLPAPMEAESIRRPSPAKASTLPSRRVESPDSPNVNDHDVLLGRGGVTNSHFGNQNFRKLVRKRQREYLVAPKLKKANIAQLIVDEVYGVGGRFLTEERGLWVEISKEKAREKTSQALREKAPELKRIYDAAEELVARKVAEKRRSRQQAAQQLQRNSFSFQVAHQTQHSG